MAGQQGAVGRTTVSPTRKTRPRLAAPPRSACHHGAGPVWGGTSVRGEAVAASELEQASGEFRVRDKAMD